jgi:glucose-6-phosphate 1-epimerase
MLTGATSRNVQCVTAEGGLPQIWVSNAAAHAAISLHGGQLLSFKRKADSLDLLFLSKRARFEPGAAIRGGIPICWPWFGADPANPAGRAHGFARNRLWSVEQIEQPAPDHTRITLGLTDCPETRTLWPYAFELRLVVSIASTLRMELITRNTGAKTFAITQALHSYFSVGAVDRVSVEGLDGTTYLDKLEDFAPKQQQGSVTFTGEVDRIYRQVPDRLRVVDSARQRAVDIAAEGSKTAVVWNPWRDTAAQMADLGDDEFQQFVCVETANAADDLIKVSPGSDYCLQASYCMTALDNA